MADLVIQRFVLPSMDGVDSLYYHGRDAKPVDRRSIALERGSRMDTDTYFNSFFESHWRRHTTLGRLVLRLQVSGRGTIRLWRWAEVNGAHIIGRADFDGENLVVELEASAPTFHSRQWGTLFFETQARSTLMTIHSAEWVAKDVQPTAVSLVAGYCTFNRETFLLKNLENLASDPDLQTWLTRVVVVDQGSRRLQAHPEFGRLSERAISLAVIVEQGNFGGSGGFTRCILAAQKVAGATHVLLLDDDAVMEPESIYRACTMLSLAPKNLAIGGPMLDMLWSNEVYESGANLDPSLLVTQSRFAHLKVNVRKNVHKMAQVDYTHYNAWWFFVFPLSAVAKVGLPFPLFIKGDDVEYGYRLMRAGIPTLPMPGLGVWHVPFHLKARGWDEYFSLRNLLAAQAICFDGPTATAIRVLGLELINRLISCDYFRAWSLCQAIEDYLIGPSLLEKEPHLPQRILDRASHWTPQHWPRTHCLLMQKVDKVPRFRPRRRIRLLQALIRQVIRSSPPPDAPPTHIFRQRDVNWHTLRSSDVAAIDDQCSEDLVVLRRNRRLFWRFLARGLWAIFRLKFTRRRTVRLWKAQIPRLTTASFWHHHLGLE